MLAQIFATFGLAVFLRSAAQAVWGVDFLVVKSPLMEGRISVAGLFLGLPQLVASAGSLAAFAGLHWFISRTETGLALQATAQDRQAVSLMGIDTQRMFADSAGASGPPASAWPGRSCRAAMSSRGRPRPGSSPGR
jgi:branched-chain amino acid transport system permease protein